MKYILLIIFLFVQKTLGSTNPNVFLTQNDIFGKESSHILNQGYALFDTKDFNEGDKMYFKVTCEYGYGSNNELLEYTFFSDFADFYSHASSRIPQKEEHYSFKDEYTGDTLTSTEAKYKIKKDKDKFEGTTGGLVLLGVYCWGNGKIENIKQEEVSTIVLAVVFSVIGVVLIVALIIYCYKKKKAQSQQMAVNNAQVNVGGNAYPYPQSNMNNMNYNNMNQNYNMPSNVNMNLNMNGHHPNAFNKY